MKLGLDLKTSLTQTLTPQQIQYLKLLQLPALQLEHHLSQEIEQNPMLDQPEELDEYESEEIVNQDDRTVEVEEYDEESSIEPTLEEQKKQIEDDSDPFEFHKLLWENDSGYSGGGSAYNDDDSDYFQVKEADSLTEDLIRQLNLIDLSDEEILLGENIIGNIDEDGYLRRDLFEILDETNDAILEINQKMKEEAARLSRKFQTDNPALQYALSDESRETLSRAGKIAKSGAVSDLAAAEISDNGVELLKKLSHSQAEKVLFQIRRLDPPGIGSRNVRECLLSQLETKSKPNAAQKLAIEILKKTYDAFIKKHFNVIMKKLEVGEEYLREALEEIRSLNPKPGGGDFQAETNSVIPDFMVERDKEKNDLIITVNDGRLPALHLNKAYEKLKKEAKYKHFNKETREWIRNKYEDAKFLIQAVRQRKSTMLKVMTAIAALQRDYFFKGPDALKPLIYKDISEKTGLDISTVCRIVNGKYVQSEYGTRELKYFFSESLPSDEGEEVSTTVIKKVIEGIVEKESKKKPYSDEKISKELKSRGYNVARRTVAKYREQLKIPVARLRKEL